MRKILLAGVALMTGLGGASAHAQTRNEGADVGAAAESAGRLSAGQTMNGAIGAEGDSDWFRIRLEAGRAYSVTLDGAGDPALSDPVLSLYGPEGGEPIAYNDDANEGLNSALEFTPIVTGDYYLEARGFSASDAGAYALRAVRGALVSPPTARPRLAPGETVSGVIETPAQKHVYRARLEAGQAYRIALSSAGETPLGDPYLRLYAPGALTPIAMDDDSGGNLNAYLEFSPTQSGEHLIEAGAFADGSTGGYEVSLRAGDIPGDAATDMVLNAEGDIRYDRLQPAGDSDWYRVNLAEGETIRIRLNKGEGASALADPMLVVYAADGAELARDDDGGGDLNSYLEFTAANAGAHFLEARGFQDDAAGDYVLEIQNGEIPAGTETGERLAPYTSRSSQLNPAGDSDWFGLDMIEGRTYRLHVEGGEGDDVLADPVLSLHGPDGAAIAADDDGGTGANAYLSYLAPASGTYYAAVSAFADQGAGSYTIRYIDTDVARDANTDETIAGEADSRAGRIDFPGDRDAYRIIVEAGARYVARVNPHGQSGALADPTLTLLNESGEEIGANDDETRRTRAAALTFTAPEEASIVYVVAGAVGEGTGGYEVLINRAED